MDLLVEKTDHLLDEVLTVKRQIFEMKKEQRQLVKEHVAEINACENSHSVSTSILHDEHAQSLERIREQLGPSKEEHERLKRRIEILEADNDRLVEEHRAKIKEMKLVWKEEKRNLLSACNDNEGELVRMSEDMNKLKELLAEQEEKAKMHAVPKRKREEEE